MALQLYPNKAKSQRNADTRRESAKGNGASLVIHKTFEEIRAGGQAPNKSQPARRAPTKRKPHSSSRNSPGVALPEFMELQLATLVDQVPSGDEWLHEVKFDGYRCLAGRDST